jgi:hypothetical protein
MTSKLDNPGVDVSKRCGCANVVGRLPKPPLQEGKRVRIHQRLNLPGGQYRAQATLTWEGLAFSKAETSLVIRMENTSHELLWVNDLRRESLLCEVDGKSIVLEPGFWRRSENRSRFKEIWKYVAESKFDVVLANLVAAAPLPELVVPLLQFSIFFSPSLRQMTLDTISERVRNRQSLYRINLGGTTFECQMGIIGPYEEGHFCPAEYHSCLDGEEGLLCQMIASGGEEGGGSGGIYEWCRIRHDNCLMSCQSLYDIALSTCDPFPPPDDIFIPPDSAPATRGEKGIGSPFLRFDPSVESCRERVLKEYLACIQGCDNQFNLCSRSPA